MLTDEVSQIQEVSEPSNTSSNMSRQWVNVQPLENNESVWGLKKGEGGCHRFSISHMCLLFLGEVLSEDSERADGSQTKHKQQQGAHPPASGIKMFFWI